MNQLKQISAFLLILLFFSISTAQIFHADEHVITTKQADATKVAQPGDQSLIQVSDHCIVCDYYVHHHGKQIHLSYALVTNLLYSELTVLKTKIYARVIETAFRNFINKGPPIIA